jgi:hypothetical protein
MENPRLSLSCDDYFTSLFPSLRMSYAGHTARGGIYSLTIYPEGYRRQVSPAHTRRRALTRQSPERCEPDSSAHCNRLVAVVYMYVDGRSGKLP